MARDEPSTHQYDDPNLSSCDFLLAVMRDKSAPIDDRIDAARWLIFIERVPNILDRISKFGELGLKEYFNSLPPVEQQEIKSAVNRLLRCNALGINEPLDWMPTKGNA